MPIQNAHCTLYTVFRHLVIDHHGRFDHRSVESKFSCFPGKVIRIQRNAVPPKPRARIKCLESIRFCFRSIDNFPQTDTHFIAQNSQFIYQTNIDVTISIFQDLLHLSNCRRRNFIHIAFKNCTIHSRNRFCSIFANCTDNLRRILCFEFLVTRINSFWREPQIKILPAFQTGTFFQKWFD